MKSLSELAAEYQRALNTSEGLTRVDLDNDGSFYEQQVTCRRCQHWPEEHPEGGECEAPGCDCLEWEGKA